MKIAKSIILIGLGLTLTSCASARAAQKTGVSVKNVAKCATLVCLQSLPTSSKVDEKDLETGQTQYVYRIQRRQGSILRSIAYGTGAFMTLGVSEILAGPVEGIIQDNKHMAAVANCDSIGSCDRLVIIRNDKEPYIVRGHTKEELAAIDSEKP